jgi:plasmid stabilization system protein ParE
MTAIRLLREAEEELRLAAQFYEEAQPGLGQALIVEVRRAKDLIAAHPRSSASQPPECRSSSLINAYFMHIIDDEA